MADQISPMVFLAAPHYGSFSPPTVAGLLTASTRFFPLVQMECASLLAYNFNRLWAECLNLRNQKPVTHFAMLHADIGPDPGWLDVLMDEMDATGADIMSAISPIKDGRGLTSTGVLDPKDMRTPPKVRRLTLKEIHALPVDTFDAESAGFPGYQFAINTGCWLARLDRPWVDKFPGFTILDSILKMPGWGHMPLVFSEDWYASQWWANNGVKVMATRKVKLTHVGAHYFRNDTPWGTESMDGGDALTIREGEVEGWMTHPELDWLTAQASQHCHIVEIGSWHGRSTKALASATPGQVIAVDNWSGSNDDVNFVLADQAYRNVGEEPRVAFMKNLSGEIALGKVLLWEMDSTKAAADFAAKGLKADMVFIDGSHDTPNVLADIRAWLPLVRPGGLLCGHDGNDPRVQKALDEAIPGWKPAKAGTIWEYQAA